MSCKATILLKRGFKTRYYDNAEYPNQLHLRHDHHASFDVRSICYDCVKENNIVSLDLEPGDRLSC